MLYIHTWPREFQLTLWETVQTLAVSMTFSLTSRMQVKSLCRVLVLCHEISLSQPVSFCIIIASLPDCELCESRSHFHHVHYYIPSAQNSAWKIIRSRLVDGWMHACVFRIFLYSLGFFYYEIKTDERYSIKKVFFNSEVRRKREVGMLPFRSVISFFQNVNLFLSGV